MCVSRSPTPKTRLGVAVLFDAEITAEIDGLRRALGEPDLGRIPPHLTLIPPVNVRDVDAAERVIRAAAATVPPFAVELGPVATFLPDNPVAYLSVGGDLDALHRLHDRVFKPPLERELSWPFVPHITIADGIDPERIAAAPDVLAAYRREVTLRSVTLLEEQGRVWEPIATVPLGPPSVIGRGGLPLELDVLDRGAGVAVTARREHVAVGWAEGWLGDGTAWLTRLEVAEAHRRDGVGSHVLAAFESWAAAHGVSRAEVSPAVELDAVAVRFLESRGWRPGRARLQRSV